MFSENSFLKSIHSRLSLANTVHSRNYLTNSCYCDASTKLTKERKENQILRQEMKKKENSLFENSQFPFQAKKKEFELLKKENEKLEKQLKRKEKSRIKDDGQEMLQDFQNNHYVRQLQDNRSVLIAENERLTKILMMRIKLAQI